MPNGLDLQAASKCSSCSVLENKSNYWTPTLYYQSPTNGTFTRVRRRLSHIFFNRNPVEHAARSQVAQYSGPLTGNPNAGMVVYYTQIGNVTSFPKVSSAFIERSSCRISV